MKPDLRLHYNLLLVKRLRRRHVVRWMLTRIDARRGYTTRAMNGPNCNIHFYDSFFGE